jgi:GNAT superfamily N-acetyltransferase
MIKRIEKEHRETLVKLISRISEFKEEEKEVAIELIDESISGNEDYITFIYILEDKIIGYYCIGRRALTDGVYDLYWIAIDPSKQGRGFGKELLSHAEKFVEENNGRWLLIETSSLANYKKTREFYLKNLYSKVAEIKDFYSKDDSLIIFGKYLIT